MFFGYVYIKSRQVTDNNKLSNNNKLVTEFFWKYIQGRTAQVQRMTKATDSRLLVLDKGY